MSIAKSTSKGNSKQQKLFDDNDSDLDMTEEISKLKINKQFEGSKGEKVCSLFLC